MELKKKMFFFNGLKLFKKDSKFKVISRTVLNERITVITKKYASGKLEVEVIE